MRSFAEVFTVWIGLSEIYRNHLRLEKNNIFVMVIARKVYNVEKYSRPLFPIHL